MQSDKTLLPCPNCRQQLRVPTDRGQLRLTCPKCHATWIWSLKSGTAKGAEHAGTSRMESIIAKKTVNALIPEAEMSFATKFVLRATGAKATEAVMDIAKKLMGGLWVGGTAIIQQKALVFRPNWLNRIVHKANYVVEIPFQEITDVDVRFGIATKIIDIITCDGKFSIRCYGAENFANKIRDQKTASIFS